MRSFLTFLSSFLVILLLYSLFFYTVSRNTKITENLSNSCTNENLLARKAKLSIVRIDSLTAFENYKFTIANYYRDYIPKKGTIVKATKI
jgi:hypothetical protein